MKVIDNTPEVKIASLIAQNIAKDFQSRPNIKGIIWIGSSSFGIVDKNVDIDIRLVVDIKNEKMPMQQFIEQDVKVEVDEIDWIWLTRNIQADSEQYWIIKRGIILYDLNKQLSNVFEEIEKQIAINKRETEWILFKAIFGDYEIQKCLLRHESEAAVMCLYRSIEAMLKFIFIFNGQPVPPLKWQWYFLKHSNMVPHDLAQNLRSLANWDLGIENKLNLLKYTQDQFKKLMQKRGYSKEKLDEYWRF